MIVLFSAVLRESDEETSDAPSSPEALPVSEKLLFSMKSDAVIRPEDSSQKRPTVLGLFASPEGNTHDKVSDSVFTSPEEVSSPQTNVLSSRSGTEISANTNEISPSSNSPLVSVNNTPVPADEDENDSDVEMDKTEATTTTNEGGALEAIKDETSERDGLPKLRFCLPGKRGARGDRVRMWGRKHKKKRRPQQTSPTDLELTATNSMSPLLPHRTSRCSVIEEQSRVFDVHSKDSDKSVDMGTEETRYSDQQHENVGSTDQITSEINRSDTQLPETNSSHAHAVNDITGDKNPPIVVISPAVEESSHWDFDMSSDQPNDSNNIDQDSSVTTKAEEDVASSMDPNSESRDPNLGGSQSITSSSMWDVPSSENNIFPEPGNQHLSASNDTENTRNPKPKRSRFTVSSS